MYAVLSISKEKKNFKRGTCLNKKLYRQDYMPSIPLQPRTSLTVEEKGYLLQT